MSKMGDRLRLISGNYRMAKENDPKLGWILLAILVVTLAAFVALGISTGNIVTWVLIGVSVTLLIEAIVFSRRAMRSAYKSLEGRPGAAVAVIENMSRAGWTVDAGVAVNRNQDIVHRAVGRAGVVLIGEGTSPALKGLLAKEQKRTKRFAAEAPISELVIGREAGQVPIAKLDKHLRSMPKVLAPGEVTTLRNRLAALTAAPVPLPKGPLPKTGRMPRGGKLR